jgi:bifunctional DNase/RNase
VIRLSLVGVRVEVPTNQPIVLLREDEGQRYLPIFIGPPEATAIVYALQGMETPRPMTHDLIKSLLLGLSTGLRKVVVSELKDDTFYAVIWLERGGEVISIDSRPSDALALALRVDSPIFVDEMVFKASKLAASASDRLTSEDLRKYLEGLNDEDLGRYKM